MTQEEREQVVELLRCAADIEQNGQDPWPIANAGRRIGFDWSVCDWAWDAYTTIECDSDMEAMLEAALRVEEGSWP